MKSRIKPCNINNFLKFPHLKYEMINLVNEFGIELQFIITIEEMSELTKEICKFLRNKNESSIIENVFNEIVDIEVMLDQIKLILSHCLKEYYPKAIIEKSNRIIDMNREIINKRDDNNK